MICIEYAALLDGKEYVDSFNMAYIYPTCLVMDHVLPELPTKRQKPKTLEEIHSDSLMNNLLKK
jgi:hypothetical protein